MSADEAKPDVDFNRAYASRALERIRHHETFAAEQVASMAKWLTASLLAVNGGAAIAVFNRSHPVDHPLSSGSLFLMGIVFALLSGTWLQEIYNRVADPLLEFDKYWTRISLTGLRDNAEETRLKQAVDRVHRFAFLAPLMGWVSGILFVAGAILLAV